LATVVSHFATLNVGSIYHHTFKTDALYCVKSRGLVKPNARGHFIETKGDLQQT